MKEMAILTKIFQKLILFYYYSSHGVVRVDQENSLTSLTLQDCGQVLPGATLIVIKVENPQPQICKTDEVGEICMASGSSGSSYWGLPGLTNQTFKIRVTDDNSPALDQDFVRSGLLGFLGTYITYRYYLG